MTRSLTAHSPIPPPSAAPWTRAITGTGQRVDRVEHLGHRHRVLLVGLAVERQRGAHPGDVRAGTERRAVAGQDDGPQRTSAILARERAEGRPQLGDQRRVERVVDVGPRERHPGDDAAGPVRSTRSASLTRASYAVAGPRVPGRGRPQAVCRLAACNVAVRCRDAPRDRSRRHRVSGPGCRGRSSSSAWSDCAPAVAAATRRSGRSTGSSGSATRYLELIGVFDRTLAERSWVGEPTVACARRGVAGWPTWAVATDDLDADAARSRSTAPGLSDALPASGCGRTGGSSAGGWPPRWRSVRPSRRSSSSTTRPPRNGRRTSARPGARVAPAGWARSARHASRSPSATRRAVGLRVLRTVGIGPFRPSLAGRGAHDDAAIGTQTIRYRRAAAPDDDRATVHLVVDGGAIEPRRIEAIACRFVIRSR